MTLSEVGFDSAINSIVRSFCREGGGENRGLDLKGPETPLNRPTREEVNEGRAK